MALHLLNDKSWKTLHDLIVREQRRTKNRGVPFSPDDLPPQSPEVYLVKLPEGGVTALDPTGTDPVAGSADCDVYNCVQNLTSGDYELSDTGRDLTVCNAGGKYGQQYYGLAQRDKFGVWWLVKVWSYLEIKCQAKGGGQQQSGSTITVDHVTVVHGVSPLDDPDDTTEELTVYNIFGDTLDDDVVLTCHYNESNDHWEVADVTCPA